MGETPLTGLRYWDIAATLPEDAMLEGCRRGCSSVVERHLPKVNVVGSSPISRLKRLYSD